MRPRDRYVFEVIDPSEDWGENLEIYFTIVDGKGNLYYQMTDAIGKCRKTVNKGNKRMSLVTDSYLGTIYSWIKNDSFTATDYSLSPRRDEGD
jgi:hypothetical protein